MARVRGLEGEGSRPRGLKRERVGGANTGSGCCGGGGGLIGLWAGVIEEELLR